MIFFPFLLLVIGLGLIGSNLTGSSTKKIALTPQTYLNPIKTSKFKNHIPCKNTDLHLINYKSMGRLGSGGRCETVRYLRVPLANHFSR